MGSNFEDENPPLDSGRESYLPRPMPEELQTALKRLALPRWFNTSMLKLLLPDRSESDAASQLEQLRARRRIEAAGRERFRVPERYRPALLAEWWQDPASRQTLKELSETLARYCSGQAKAAKSESQREEWRYEQLYHLAVAAPGNAMRLMKIWFDQAVEKQFDLNQGYRWLLPLEERRDWLAALEAERKPNPGWTAELVRLREYLSARSYWSEAWYKTINYLPRKQLLSDLDRFFGNTGSDAPWLMSLHAPGGHGKSTTLDWMLARYVLPPPRRYICVRFEFGALSMAEQLEIYEQPEKLLPLLAENLNAQRAHKIEAFERQDELRDDPVGAFTMVLRETYGETTVVLFLDGLDALLEHAAQPARALADLLALLRRIKQGDIAAGGSIPGYDRLRVVFASRYRLRDDYAEALRQAFDLPKRKGKPGGPLVELELSAFSREEGNLYLTQKRKLTDQAKKLIRPILTKAAEVSAPVTHPSGKKKSGKQLGISPLKLALYADLVKEEPNITPEAILNTDDIDLAYLVNRILLHIQDPAIHWLLRYGVIFRRLDAEAAQVLMPFLEQALAGKQDLDDPQLDPQAVRQALAAAQQQATGQLPNVEDLLEQLTQYSWVDREGDYIQFHRDVREPLLQIVARQKIYGLLQEAAFQHYARRAEQTEDSDSKASCLREAIFHSLQTGNSAGQYWREQFVRYQYGPGPVLWALVDEALRVNREQAAQFLSDNDRLDAYLALANVLLYESDLPFLPGQLNVAEDAARRAMELAENMQAEARRFQASLIMARIALARHKLAEALALARRSVEQAEQAGSEDQQVEAMKVLGRAEAANNLWSRALATVRKAYERSLSVLGLGEARQEVRLELIEHLLISPDWREAITLLQEAQEAAPGHPAVLVKAAAVSIKLARLKEAARYYQEANATGYASELELIQIYRGQLPTRSVEDDSLLAVVTAAARADWLEMERLLRAHLASASNSEILEVINTLLHFYLEVTGDWRQVKALLERGERWSKKRHDSDPAIARFSVLSQYFEFLTSSLLLEPNAARQEVERRLNQVRDLDTPEDRVRVKGYLLLVRFFGVVVPDIADPEELEAIKIYRQGAAQALERSLDILARLAPIDQVDVMRTIAALPGWSSQLVNEVAPDPAERSPLLLLVRSFEPPGSQEQPPFLVRLAQDTGLQVEARLAALQHDIAGSGADWPILYSSFARLLAAFGQPEAGLQFLNAALWERPLFANSETENAARPEEPLLVVLDRAFLSDWSEASRLIEEAIVRLEVLPEATSLVNELMLTWAYLGLAKNKDRAAANDVAVWLTRLFALPFTNPGNAVFLQEYYLLQAITAHRLGHADRALANLKQALNVAEGLGNNFAIEIITSVKDQLEAQQQLSSGQPQQQLRNAIKWLESKGQFLQELQDFLIEEPVREEAQLPPAPEPVLPPAPGGIQPGEIEVLLAITQLDNTSIEVVFMRSDQDYIHARTETKLQGVKKLLPQGKALAGLPDMDYWQKLLNEDSNLGLPMEQVGAALLDDLLPGRSRGRKQLETFLNGGESGKTLSAIRLLLQSPELERLPWGLLYDAATGRWLSRYFRFSRNRQPNDAFALQGASIAVRPLADRPDPDGRLKQLASMYSGSNLYGPELLGQGHTEDLTVTSARSLPDLLPRPLKILHLVGDLSEVSEVEGIFLNLGRSRTERTREPLTADALAHQLRQLGISRSLIILEPLSTGSYFEDIRVLLLRNSYAANLARLGTWTVLAVGPRRSSYPLIQQLLEAEKLSAGQLEDMLLKARQQKRSGHFLDDQFSLTYPIT